MAQFIKNRWLKIIALTATVFLTLVVMTSIALQIPAVQTRIIQYLTNFISLKTGYHITIDRISIEWLDKFTSENMVVYDLEENLMIKAKYVTIDYEFRALLGRSTKVIDLIEINEAEVNARIIDVSDTSQNLNLTEFMNRIRDLNTSTSGRKPQIIIEEISLNNSVFSYWDYRRDTVITGFNYNKFSINNINTTVNDLYAHADTLQMNIKNFHAIEPENNLPIHSITGQFRLSRQALEFNGIEIKLGKSIVRDTVILAFDSPQDLQNFTRKVEIRANLEKSILHSEDLALFIPALENLNDEYRLSGNFQGSVNNFSLRQAILHLGNGTKLEGIIRMEGLPNIQETFMNYKLTNSYILISDLKPYLKPATIERLEPLHHLSLNGQLIGFVNDFVANGVFETALGRIQSDINVKLAEDINNSDYSGQLSLIDFHLGRYANNPELKRVTLNGKIKGNGLTVNNADFRLEGSIDKFDFRKYTYTNIKTNGQFRNKYFEGNLEIKDPNAKISLSGAIDLKDKAEKFQLQTLVEILNLKPLNLSQKDITFSGNAWVNATGLTIDSILGEGIISDAYIRVDEKSLLLDSLKFNSKKILDEREITLDSDLVAVNLSGKFTPTLTFDNIKLLLKEYRMTVENNSEVITDYYNKKEHSVNDYSLNYEVLVKDFNPFLNLINDSIYLASGTSVSGDLTGGYNSNFTINVQSDSIRYRTNAIKNAVAEFSISKAADSAGLLSVIYLASEKQDVGAVLKTENLKFESVWNYNHIDFNFYVDQENSTNYTDIQGNIDFAKDLVMIAFDRSDIHLFDETWNISSNNLISFSPGNIKVKDLMLFQDNQIISVDGRISREAGHSLEIKLDSIGLYNLNPILLKPVDGIINGKIVLADVYEDLKLNISGIIKDFKVEKFLIGNISGSSFYHKKKKSSEIDLVVERKGILTGTVKGLYKPREKEQQFDLEARLNKAPLNILEPFLESYFTSFRGTTSGEFNLTGSVRKPVFAGKGVIENAGMHVNYLNTPYSLNGTYSLGKNVIDFEGINITDAESNQGAIQGVISHDYFNRWALNLQGNVNNFLLLNTTSKDNDLFYGKGYGTGSISFTGPVNNLIIDAKARTDAGTRIFIPIGESGEIEKEEFINFVSFSDTLQGSENARRKTDLTGINLNIALDVTPDAYTEIIFDIKSGDIIRGRGEGDLQLRIDPTGDFHMFGDFYIHQGGYNFTLYNIVNKEFEILPDSRISWYGDPYQGQMEIKASYEQLASLQPVISQTEGMEAQDLPQEIKRKYPSRVLMDLNGPLLNPTIDFNIEVDNLPNYPVLVDGAPVEMNFLFSRFKDSWDEQELNRQVFSLIVLRKFSPLQSFNTGGSIASSVSELLSNQLSYWITQVNENLEIDVDFGSLDEEAFNTFQLRLAYTMLDGRLRIIRDGGVVTNNSYGNTSNSNVPYIGDWTVEYLLTPDGQLRVKMYNRMNYNTLDVTNQNNVLTTGFSIQHIQSFDELKEIFKRKKKEKEENEADSVRKNSEAILNKDEVL